ncbi:histidine kinase [Salinibacterium sp. TMP30]|uniref:sensor histidine kinase n=1 Tax=Salinibacterium sp. TMP30 TaxID=3138237 RepID=UPI0031392940
MPRRAALILDVGVSVALTTALVVEQVLLGPNSGLAPAITIALAVVIGGSLAFRRAWPLTSYAIGSAALIVQSLWVDASSLSPYANLIGLFSLGMYGTHRRALWGPVILAPGVIAYFANSSQPIGLLTLSTFGLWFAAWAIGYQIARGREQSAGAREASRREALADERVRIARELHDVVGHTVNLVLVQAGASRLIMDSDPARAKTMLGEVENTARQALGELDQMLGLLRDDADSVAQPGIRGLPALGERLAAVGLTVEFEIDPKVSEAVPPQVDIVVYRIVQEALTNAFRHGKASSAVVRVHGTEPLIVDISDTGHGPTAYQPGRGLRGMEERVALFGGTLTHHRDARGFHVHAELVLP